MTRVLFVGGHADGTWLDIDDLDEFAVRVFTKESDAIGPPPYDEGTAESIRRLAQAIVVKQTYRRHRFLMGGSSWQTDVFAIGEMTADEVFQRLMRHYRPESVKT